jgi:PTH1 family peptidyl-tRNA hydrolase
VLVVGLGNPGTRYAGNRHNIGFMAVEAIARRCNAAPWRERFEAEYSECSVGGERVRLLKPQTYMNLSGISVAKFAHFFKIDRAQLVVLHDELDLPPAKLRVKTGGSDGGHNGLRSITEHFGSDYRRVRFGIGHPGARHLVEHYVLSDFAKAERPWVDALTEIVADNASVLLQGKDSTFQNRVHLAMDAKGFGDVSAPGKPE